MTDNRALHCLQDPLCPVYAIGKCYLDVREFNGANLEDMDMEQARLREVIADIQSVIQQHPRSLLAHKLLCDLCQYDSFLWQMQLKVYSRELEHGSNSWLDTWQPQAQICSLFRTIEDRYISLDDWNDPVSDFCLSPCSGFDRRQRVVDMLVSLRRVARTFSERPEKLAIDWQTFAKATTIQEEFVHVPFAQLNRMMPRLMTQVGWLHSDCSAIGDCEGLCGRCYEQGRRAICPEHDVAIQTCTLHSVAP